MSKRRLGMFVVALILVVLLGLGYYYSAVEDSGSNTLLVAVRGYLSVEQQAALGAQLNGYTPNEGKPVVLEVFEFPASGEAGSLPAELAQKLGQLRAAMDSGEANLLLLDRYVYELLGDEQLFEDLSVRYPNDAAVSGKYLYAVAGKPFANANGLQDLPEVYLALRNAQSASVNKNAKTLKKYSIQSKTLDNIAYSTPPEGYAEVGLK